MKNGKINRMPSLQFMVFGSHRQGWKHGKKPQILPILQGGDEMMEDCPRYNRKGKFVGNHTWRYPPHRGRIRICKVCGLEQETFSDFVVEGNDIEERSAWVNVVYEKKVCRKCGNPFTLRYRTNQTQKHFRDCSSCRSEQARININKKRKGVVLP